MLCVPTLAAVAVLHRALQPGRYEETEEKDQTWPSPVPHAGPLGFNGGHGISSHDDREAAEGALNGYPDAERTPMVWTAVGQTRRSSSLLLQADQAKWMDHTVGLLNAPPIAGFI